MANRIVLCPYCFQQAQLVTGAKIYPKRHDLHKLKFWLCEDCAAYVGTHKNSTSVPLGRLANHELRKAKMNAHKAFDVLWKNGGYTRKSAYQWLAKQLNIPEDTCHIGEFDLPMCQQVIYIMTEHIK